MMPLVILLCVAIVGYTYVGYPALLYVLTRLRRHPAIDCDLSVRGVSALVVVYNGAGMVQGRIQNLLAQVDLPDRYEVVVASDGSTDETVQEAKALNHPQVRVVAFAERRGKSAVLNDVIPQCMGDVVVLADVRQRFAQNTVAVLTRAVSQRGVAAVSGELMILNQDGGETGEALQSYWSYEKLLRHLESGIDSTCGCTGACYAIRRSAYLPIDERTILDDVAIPMRMVLAGHRVLFDRAARAFDTVCPDRRDENRRKVRTLMGNLQLCRLYPEFLRPWTCRIWFQFLSHKVLRLVTPFALLTCLAASVVWAVHSQVGVVALGFQALAYALGVAGLAWRTVIPTLLRIPAAVVMMNLCVLKAWWMYARGQTTAAWTPTAVTSETIDRRL